VGTRRLRILYISLEPECDGRSLVRIIHDFPGRLDKGEEFPTQVTETTHRDRGEPPEIFSVPSAVQWFGDTDTLNSL